VVRAPETFHFVTYCFYFCSKSILHDVNERVDILARKAVISGGHAMGHADILHAIREAGRMEDSRWNSDSTTTGKLKDGRVKLVTARHECFAAAIEEL
jgi:hypothetical protein